MDSPLSFTPDGSSWKATVELESWKGIHYSRNAETRVSDGRVDTVFAPEGWDGRPLSASDVRLVEWFVDNEAAVSKAALEALLDAYPEMQNDIADFLEDNEELHLMPDVGSTDDLRKLIRLGGVFIHQIPGDVPYTGLSFSCSWEREHGLGILMRGTRLVRIGGADVSFLLWMARQDAESATR